VRGARIERNENASLDPGGAGGCDGAKYVSTGNQHCKETKKKKKKKKRKINKTKG
jgi:hypothetical protein